MEWLQTEIRRPERLSVSRIVLINSIFIVLWNTSAHLLLSIKYNLDLLNVCKYSDHLNNIYINNIEYISVVRGNTNHSRSLIGYPTAIGSGKAETSSTMFNSEKESKNERFVTQLLNSRLIS